MDGVVWGVRHRHTSPVARKEDVNGAKEKLRLRMKHPGKRCKPEDRKLCFIPCLIYDNFVFLFVFSHSPKKEQSLLDAPE